MILPKEEIGYIFNPYVLLPGDILLMNTYEERLRKKMGCKYEHATIYLGDAYLMEANGVYDVMTHIYSYAFRGIEDACVLRVKSISPITCDSVARAARQKMGREYEDTKKFRYVRALKNTDRKNDTNRSFCSRLVAQAYACEGINLLPNADYSMSHYDHTILPDYKQLHLQLVTIVHYCPDFKVGIFLRDYIGEMVNEAIECRKRFEDLYVEAFTRNEEAFLSFVGRYSVYHDYEYHDRPTDISFILREVMKVWEKNE